MARERTDVEQIGARFDRPTIDRIDAMRDEMVKRTPGLKLTRADIVRILVERGLAATSAASAA